MPSGTATQLLKLCELPCGNLVGHVDPYGRNARDRLESSPSTRKREEHILAWETRHKGCRDMLLSCVASARAVILACKGKGCATCLDNTSNRGFGEQTARILPLACNCRARQCTRAQHAVQLQLHRPAALARIVWILRAL
eukprot:6211227-Pleurochrysis_carterae.AAC.2